jgi:hypothetical protein
MRPSETRKRLNSPYRFELSLHKGASPSLIGRWPTVYISSVLGTEINSGCARLNSE